MAAEPSRDNRAIEPEPAPDPFFGTIDRRSMENALVLPTPVQFRSSMERPLDCATLTLLQYILNFGQHAGGAPFVHDAGTGKGFLPIAIRQGMPAARVLATDIDPSRFGEGGAPSIRDTVDWQVHDLRTQFPTADRQVNVLVLSMVLMALDDSGVDHVAAEAKRTLADRGIVAAVITHHDRQAHELKRTSRLAPNFSGDFPEFDSRHASDRFVRGEHVIPRIFARHGLVPYAIMDVFEKDPPPERIEIAPGVSEEPAALRLLLMTWPEK